MEIPYRNIFGSMRISPNTISSYMEFFGDWGGGREEMWAKPCERAVSPGGSDDADELRGDPHGGCGDATPAMAAAAARRLAAEIFL